MPGTALPRGNSIGPSNWAVSYAACAGTPWEDDSDDQTLFETMATTYLWEWTARKYGLDDVTIRPCRKGCTQLPTFFAESPYVRAFGLVAGAMEGIGGWLPILFGDGLFGPLMCGDCGMSDDCSCGYVSSFWLPGPVASVTQIVIDGSVLSTDAYRLDGMKLVRTDGGHWPHCQLLGEAAGQPGTWSIEYQRGLPVPMGGQVAAGILAIELSKAACNDGTCQLPQRVQTITRQGVTMAMLDDFTNSLDQGYTGIWVVDSWIASVMKPKMSALVVSPDYRRPGRSRNIGR